MVVGLLNFVNWNVTTWASPNRVQRSNSGVLAAVGQHWLIMLGQEAVVLSCRASMMTQNLVPFCVLLTENRRPSVPRALSHSARSGH